MATKKDEKKDEQSPRYVVMNPHGHPDGVPVITIDGDGATKQRHYFAGDVYEGPRPEEFREEGVLMTPKQAEEVEKAVDRATDETEAPTDPESEGA